MKLVLDANLILLYVCARRPIPVLLNHPKLRQDFERADLDTILRITSNYREIWVTPQVLAEASNLLGNKDRGKAARALLLKDQLQIWGEHWTRSKAAFERQLDQMFFAQYGVADWSVYRCCKEMNADCLTMDGELFMRLQSLNVNAMNFNHERGLED